jgi:hypothetical protein
MSSWAFHPLAPSAAVLSGNTALFKYWDGSEWVAGTLNIYDGSDFVAVEQINIWDGNDWKIITLRTNV